MTSADCPATSPAKIVWGLACVTLALAACGGSEESGELQKRLDSIRATGAPVTFTEVDAQYDAGSDGRRAGQALWSALDLYVRPAEADEDPLLFHGDYPELGEPIPDAVMNASRAQVLANSVYLRELTRVLDAHSDFRFPIDLTQGPAVELPHLAWIRSGVRTLCMRAYLSAADGDAATAVADLAAALKLADAARHEGILISQLARLGAMTVALSVIEDITNRFLFDDSSVRQLMESTAVPKLEGTIHRMLTGERAFLIAQDWDNLPPEAQEFYTFLDELRQAAAAYGGTRYYDREKLNLLNNFDKLLAIGSRPPHEWKRLKDALADEIRARNEIGHIVSRNLLLALVAAYPVENRLLALQRVTQAGLAVYRHALRSGEFPNTLDQLVPQYLAAVPLDPFTGQPLKWVVRENTFIVYSVGNNGIDDNGREPADGQDVSQGGDITFHVQRRAAPSHERIFSMP